MPGYTRFYNPAHDNDATTPASAAWANHTEDAIYELKHQKFNVVDYGAVGDGVTDDTVAVQAAVTAASPVRGVVYFPPGLTFLCSNILLLQDTRIWGYGSTIKQKTGQINPLLWRQQGQATITNVQILGLRIVGDNVRNGALDARSGISLTAVNNVLIRDCEVYYFNQACIGVGGCRKVLIDHNYVHDSTTANGANAIHVDGDYSDQGNAAKYGDVVIVNNTVETIVTGGIGATPQTSTQSARTNMTIANNIIRGCGWSGIYLEAQWIRRCAVIGNQIFDCGDGIISSIPNVLFAGVEAVQFVSIIGNVIDAENHSGGSNGRGIVFAGSNGSIVGNTIRASREGIYVDRTVTGTNGTGNVVQGNNITIANSSNTLGPSGIGANGQRAFNVTGNTIRMEAGSGMGAGLYIQNSKFFKIANNEFYQLDEQGITIGDGCTHGDVDFNLIVDVNAGGVSAVGIRVSDASIDYISIRGNRIIDSGTATPASSGITVSTNPTNIVLENNHIVGLSSTYSLTTPANIIRDRGNFRNNLQRNGDKGVTVTPSGATAVINIPHNMGVTPKLISAQPANDAARALMLTNPFKLDADGTNFILTFASNPAAVQLAYDVMAWL